MDSSTDKEIRRALYSAIDTFFDHIEGKDTHAHYDRKMPNEHNRSLDCLSLPEMAEVFVSLDTDTWGRFILSHDMLHAKIPSDHVDEFIHNASMCGQTWARRTHERFQTTDPDMLAKSLGITIQMNGAHLNSEHLVFAQFIPETTLTIMSEPLKRYQVVRQQLMAQASHNQHDRLSRLLPTSHIVRSLLVSHELFHVIEDQNEATIYTRTAKILLWKLLGFENHSTLRGLSEIGAGAFAQELVGVTFCPFALDILLTWAYDASKAQALYADVLADI